jgi:hypothetical protein
MEEERGRGERGRGEREREGREGERERGRGRRREREKKRGGGRRGKREKGREEGECIYTLLFLTKNKNSADGLWPFPGTRVLATKSCGLPRCVCNAGGAHTKTHSHTLRLRRQFVPLPLCL